LAGREEKLSHHILNGAPGDGMTVLPRGLERAGLAVVEEAMSSTSTWT
jgi:predicted ATPase